MVAAVAVATLIARATAGAAGPESSIADAWAAIERHDLAAAAATLEPLAVHGDAQAQAALSVVLEAAAPVIPSGRTSLQWLEQATAQGLAPAALELGNRYYTGTGVAADPRAAAGAWRVAARAGIARAQYNLGIAHVLGTGVERDAQTAADWLVQAARGGETQAHYALAVLHAGATLGPPDLASAREHLQAAAEAGHARAQYELAVLCERGLGGPADPLQARRWYAAAASRGILEAQAIVARLAPEGVAAGDPAVKPPAAGVMGPEWIQGQAPDHYTLQVATGYDVAALRDVLTRGVPHMASTYFRLDGSATGPFTAIAGSFATLEEANAALQTLPRSLRSNHPWVRRFSVLQQRLGAARAPPP